MSEIEPQSQLGNSGDHLYGAKTSYQPISFAAFDETIKIENWVSMVSAVFEPFDQYSTQKKVQLIEKVPRKYYDFLMENFSKPIDELLKALQNKVLSEPLQNKKDEEINVME